MPKPSWKFLSIAFLIVPLFVPGNIIAATGRSGTDSIQVRAAYSLGVPTRIIVPSIGLDAPIQDVGLNARGEMDVPAGTTNNVGWYQFGTVPGQIGSAVLDAHVFAAFSKLKYLKTGSMITIETSDGKTLEFKVTDSEVYKLTDVPLQLLFSRNDTRRLNLITCAGNLVPDRSTYDHRLIVYTKLVHQS
jgi:sortase A